MSLKVVTGWAVARKAMTCATLEPDLVTDLVERLLDGQSLRRERVAAVRRRLERGELPDDRSLVDSILGETAAPVW